jgi:hypothetical protein
MNTRSFLPEAADSSLITTAELGGEPASEVLLRLRLQLLINMLLGNRVFISEGWALDSISFHIIMREVALSVRRLRDKAGRYPTALDSFSPVRIELHNGVSYLDTFIRYLRRDDCRWSGFPGLRFQEGADVRGKLVERLRQLQGQSKRDAVAASFEEALGNRIVAEAVAETADYTSRHSTQRISEWRRPNTGFAQNIVPSLSSFADALANTDHESARPHLARLIDRVRAELKAGDSSSTFLALARAEVPDELMPALDYITRAAYMRLSTFGEGASFGAPLRDAASSPLLGVADRVMSGGTRVEALEITGREGHESRLLMKLEQLEDWSSIWDSAITLAIDPDWLTAVGAMRSAAADMRFPEYLSASRHIFEPNVFRNLEQRLQAACPQLALTQTLGERWLRLSVAGSKRADQVLQVAVVSAPFALISPAVAAAVAAGSGLAISTAAGKLVDRAAGALINPLSGTERVATTVFRLIPPRQL